MSTINFKHFSRFNEVYENPFNFFEDYLEANINFSDIKKKCMSKKINSETRAFIYKILLNILPYNEQNSWKKIVNNQRNLYYTKLNNILSKDENILKFINCHAIKGTKEYEEIFCLIPEEIKEILSLIKLDVDRTFQDLDLFSNIKIKELLTKILLVYSIDNPIPSYCQGMNEILGTLFLAFYPSLIYNKFSNEEMDKENNDNITDKEKLYYFLFSDEFFEADLYTIYVELMSRNITILYTYNEAKYQNVSTPNEDLNNLTMDDINRSAESDLMKRIKKIFYIYLKSDKEYFDVLFKNIEPNIFLLRWILCLLNREISLKNILWIWDCIFFYEFMEFTFKKDKNDKNDLKDDKENKNTRLNFLDFICLAMIFDLKNEIIHSEPSVILCKFLKYPNEKNMKKIMKAAFKYSQTINEGNTIWNLE